MPDFVFFLLLFTSAIPAIYGHCMAQRSLMPYTARFSGPGWKPRSSAQRRGYSWLRLTAAKMWRRGRAVRGPTGTEKWGEVDRLENKVRFGWGNTFWRCRFSWGYLLIEWKYMGDAKEKMAHSYPPVVGSFFALKTMSWWVVPYHIPSHQYERPDGHYCLPLSKKKKHLIPATQQKGGTVPSYVLYIPLYYSWYPTISYPHYWLPNYILIISPDPIGGFHAPWATSATSNKMPNSWTKLMAETSSIYI